MRVVILGLLFALTLLSSACVAKRITVAGKEMTEPEANAYAEAELARVRALAATQQPERAAQSFESLAARLGSAAPAAEAYYEAALRWRTLKRPDRALANLSELLTRFPLSPRASDAKFQLALSQMEAGRPRDALQTLSSLYDKLPVTERTVAARRLGDAAEATRLWPLAVRWRAETAAQLQGTARDREMARVKEIVDSRLSQQEVARLREELPSDSLALPVVLLKVAQQHLQFQQIDQAQTTAQELVDRWPTEPQAVEARSLLDRLARRDQVRPGTLGLAIPLSGKFKAWGEAIQQAAAMALEGSSLKVLVRDTRGEPDGAAKAMEALAIDEGAMAVIGGVANAEAQRAATSAQELGLPFISLSKAEGVTDAGPFIFRNMLTSSAQARALADFATRQGMRRFALLYPNIPYGQELANAFWDEVDGRGGEVRGAEIYEPDRTTFAPLVKSMVGKLHLEERGDYGRAVSEITRKEPNPFRRNKALEKLRRELKPIIDFDAVFIPDFAKNVTLIAPALAVEDVVTTTCDSRALERIRKSTGREELRPVQLLGANGWDDPSLFEKAGRYVECAVIVDGFFAGSGRAETRRFTEEFQKRYQRPPTILEASAYDAARMLRLILERERPQLRDLVRNSLAAVKDFKGAAGDLSFDARREPVKPLFFLTVDKTGLREMTKEELAGPGVPGS